VTAAFANGFITPTMSAAEKSARDNILLSEGGKVKDHCSKQNIASDANSWIEFKRA